MKKLLLLLLLVSFNISAISQTVKRRIDIHDLSAADARHVMDANIGNLKIFTCQISWAGIIGTGSKVILRGSNNGVDFDNLGIEVVMTVGTGSATLSDDKFPHDIGAAFVEKNSATAGVITLNFLAK